MKVGSHWKDIQKYQEVLYPSIVNRVIVIGHCRFSGEY